jgi:hypothetical protein
MKKGIVLSLCDLSGNMCIPWAQEGYECYCYDIQHIKEERVKYGEGLIIKLSTDILDLSTNRNKNTDYKITFAFPPCTHLAVSGSRWFKQKGMGKLIEALTLVEKCREICEGIGAPYMIENPISTVSTYWRKPDYIFNPCDYGGYLNPPGDQYTKKTCLWTGNGFRMPEPKSVEPVYGSKMHLLGPSPDRANLRSETPMGFAEAVFQANEQV